MSRTLRLAAESGDPKAKAQYEEHCRKEEEKRERSKAYFKERYRREQEKYANTKALAEQGDPQAIELLAEYDRDVFGTCLLHVDFKQIRMDEKLTTSVPVVLVGEAAGVQEGGIVEQMVRELEIECLPTDIPAHIEVDVTALGMGHHLTVADVVCPQGVEIKTEPSEVVVSVAIPRAAAVEAATKEATEGEGEAPAAEAE